MPFLTQMLCITLRDAPSRVSVAFLRSKRKRDAPDFKAKAILETLKGQETVSAGTPVRGRLRFVRAPEGALGRVRALHMQSATYS